MPRPGLPRRHRLYSSLILPANPSGFSPNWGNPLTRNLAYLFLPHPLGFYFDLVRGRIATFQGANANAIIPQQTAFGMGFQMGASAGGQNAYAGCQDGTLQPPQSGISMASGAWNQAAIGNVLTSFGNWQSAGSLNNRLGIFCQNVSGTPRMQTIIEVAGTSTVVTGNGGAGITMTVAGQYMTYSASYDKATLLANYTSTGQGNQIGSSSTARVIPGSLNFTANSDAAAASQNMARTNLWFAGWNRALSASELVTVCASVGGLPSGVLRGP